MAYRVPGLAGRSHQLVAGVRDQRRAGVRHQCDRLLARRRAAFGRASGGIVFVIGRERRRDAVALVSLRVTRVSSQAMTSAAGQQFERAQGDVAQVSDGVATR